MTDFDTQQHKHVVEYADYLRHLHQTRNTMFDDMQKYLVGEWDEENNVRTKMNDVKLTKHPGPMNVLQGAIRLLIATDPTFSCSTHIGGMDSKDIGDKIEKLAGAIWKAAGEIRGEPIHYDIVTSMLTFAEVHIGITRTEDMLAVARQSQNKAEIERLEEMNEVAPVVFDVWDPRTGYPDIGSNGLRAFYREVETLTGEVMDQFPDARDKNLQAGNRYDTVTLCHFWDTKHRDTWIKGSDIPLLQEDLPTPFIPIVVELGEGSRLLDKVEYWRRPFLYSLWKSGMWNRQNLMLTVFYTMVYGIGVNPMFLYKANQPNKRLAMDFSRPGGVVTIDRDEDLTPMVKNILDPSMMEGLAIAERLAEESTLYGQTLGEPLGKNAAFSMVALLHQAGRLPLTVPQRKASVAVAHAVKIALKWIKQAGKKATAGYGDFFAEMKPSEIPTRFVLESMLDISLPQDKLQSSQTAAVLTAGDNPIVSNRWVRENLLNIGQSDEMTKEIWDERAQQVKHMNYIAEQMEAAKARLQALTMPPQQQPTEPPPGEMMMDEPPPMAGTPAPMPPAMMQAPNAPGEGI